MILSLFLSFVASLALRCIFNPVNCPAVICLARIAFLSSFGRETSLVNVMGPRSIFPPLFTPLVYFLCLLSVAVTTIIFLPLCLILCKQQGRRDWQPLCTRWEQSYLSLCAGLRQLSSQLANFWCRCHLLVSL